MSRALRILVKIRLGRPVCGGRTVPLLLVAWLNVILQPCAMALSGGSVACPACPPMDMHGAPAASEAHIRMPAVAAEEAEAPAADDGPSASHSDACSGNLVDCAGLDEINQSDRSVQLATETCLSWLAPLPSGSLDQHVLRRAVTFGHHEIGRSIGASPPLNVLYCVYLK